MAQLHSAGPPVGWAAISSVPCCVDQKSPFQQDFDYTQLSSSSKFNTAMTGLGQAPAGVHARSDQEYSPAIVPYSMDSQITAVANSSGLQSEISIFAFSYAQQIKLDWRSFESAQKAGMPLN